MNLAATLAIYAGGPGSGCRGSNCGRPKTSETSGSPSLKVNGNGWLTSKGILHQNNKDESHYQSAIRLGLAKENVNTRDAIETDDAQKAGNIRVILYSGLPKMIGFHAEKNDANTRALIVKALGDNLDSGQVIIDFGIGHDTSTFANEVSPQTAIKMLQNPKYGRSEVSKWHVSSARVAA